MLQRRCCLCAAQKEKTGDTTYCGHTHVMKVRSRVGQVFLVVHYMLLEPQQQHINIPLRYVMSVVLPRASLYDPHADDFITQIFQPEKRRNEMHHSDLLGKSTFVFVCISYLVTNLNQLTYLTTEERYPVKKLFHIIAGVKQTIAAEHYKSRMCWKLKETHTRMLQQSFQQLANAVAN